MDLTTVDLRPSPPQTRWQWCRLVGNMINLTTPGGLAVAVIGGAKIRRGPRGLFLCEGYRLKFPVAGAFTIGNVITTGSTWEQKLSQYPRADATRGAAQLAVPLLPRPAVLRRVRDLHGLVDVADRRSCRPELFRAASGARDRRLSRPPDSTGSPESRCHPQSGQMMITDRQTGRYPAAWQNGCAAGLPASGAAA